jgi:hypothetical protein
MYLHAPEYLGEPAPQLAPYVRPFPNIRANKENNGVGVNFMAGYSLSFKVGKFALNFYEQEP